MQDLKSLKEAAQLVASGEYSINDCNKFVELSGPKEVLALIAELEQLRAEKAASEEEILALHRKLAGETLRADQG